MHSVPLEFSEHLIRQYTDGPVPGTEDPAAVTRRRGNAGGKDLVQLSDSRRVPEEPSDARTARIAKRAARFKAEGRREGVDFVVSEDGLHTYAVE